jgi:hypothetical protein
MIYFIIWDTLTMIYLFYNLQKNLNKASSQTGYPKVKNVTFNETEWVLQRYYDQLTNHYTSHFVVWINKQGEGAKKTLKAVRKKFYITCI